jgi:hypothetical protein
MLIDLTTEFPINSQTSNVDKEVLLKIRTILKKLPSYSYLEIGSYLGGSLTPFLKDDNCTKILSVDDRELQQPDERGAIYDYSGITHDTRIRNLQFRGFDTSKMEVFDGSISEYDNKNELYDFIFIDGEHTDWACFRDFIHSEKYFKEDCIIAFHDTQLIYKSIKIINELLISRGVKFKFFKINESAISCLFLNKYADINVDEYFSIEHNLEQFYKVCEDDLLMEAVRHRIQIINPRQPTFRIKPHPVFKQ